MQLNSNQRQILAIGIVILGGLAVIVPWTDGIHAATLSSEQSVGYSLIFAPPESKWQQRGTVHVDWPRVLVPMFVVMAGMAVGVVLTAGKKTEPEKIKTPAPEQQPAKPAASRLAAGLAAMGTNGHQPTRPGSAKMVTMTQDELHQQIVEAELAEADLCAQIAEAHSEATGTQVARQIRLHAARKSDVARF